MNNWKETTLGDLSLKITKGTTPTTEGGGFVDFGVNFIKAESISEDGRFLKHKFAKIDEITNQKLKRSIIQKKDILFSIAGVIGRVALVQDDILPANTNQALAIIRLDQDKVDTKFIYYFLSNKQQVKYANSLVAQSVQANINLAQLGGIPILLPPLPEQKQIASVLSSLDGRIELLRAENETLEKIAQGIFKEWFVNFKIDGKKLKLKNGVPEGWRIGKLKDCIDFVIDNRGKTPPIIEKQLKSIPMVEVNALTRGSRIIDMDQCRKYVSRDTFNNWFRKGHPSAGDVLISTVGSVGQLAQVFNEEICIAQNIIALRHTGFSNYLYGLLKNIQKEIISIDISSVQPSIKVPHLLNIEIIMPSNEIKVDFEKVIRPFSEKIYCNNSQIQTLSRLRDTLLPKLMSGEVILR